MQSMQNAMRAYAAASARRSFRAQEADVFLMVAASLRRARDSETKLGQVRALADNDRLWIAVMDVARDPENALPQALRAALVSVGLAVQRELHQSSPDFDFLIAVNEDIAAGLSADG